MEIWEKPCLIEVAMNAEVGAYQDDFDPGESPISKRRIAAEPRHEILHLDASAAISGTL